MDPPPMPAASASSPPISFLTSAIPVPTFGPGGTFSVFCSTYIASKPEAGFRAVLDHGSYHLWNSFTPHFSIDTAQPADGHSNRQAAPTAALGATDVQPGTRFSLSACLTHAPWPFALRSRVALEVTRVETLSATGGRTGYRVAWKTIGQPPWFLRAERVQEFVLAGDDGEGSEYRCWETFGGIMAWLVKLFLGELLRRRFAENTANLKAWCERSEGEQMET